MSDAEHLDDLEASEDAHSPQRRETRDASEGHRRPVRLFYPEYDAVESLLGFGLFYLIVDRATPVVVDVLAGPLPDLVPGPVTTALAALLWLSLVTMVGATVLQQLQKNPRTFDDRAGRDGFLDANRPDGRDYGVSLALVVLGGVTAVLTWETFVAVLRGTIVVVDLDGGVPSALTLPNVAVFVVFVLAFAACARGIDRLVIGGVRELIYRYYLTDRG